MFKRILKLLFGSSKSSSAEKPASVQHPSPSPPAEAEACPSTPQQAERTPLCNPQQHHDKDVLLSNQRSQSTPSCQTPVTPVAEVETPDVDEDRTPALDQHRFIVVDGKTAGVQNTIRRYAEKRPVQLHFTPFEKRVDEQLHLDQLAAASLERAELVRERKGMST